MLPRKSRLRIERVDLGWTAVHIEVDDALNRRTMRALNKTVVLFATSCRVTSERTILQQSRQGYQPESIGHLT